MYNLVFKGLDIKINFGFRICLKVFFYFIIKYIGSFVYFFFYLFLKFECLKWNLFDLVKVNL